MYWDHLEWFCMTILKLEHSKRWFFLPDCKEVLWLHWHWHIKCSIFPIKNFIRRMLFHVKLQNSCSKFNWIIKLQISKLWKSARNKLCRFIFFLLFILSITDLVKVFYILLDQIAVINHKYMFIFRFPKLIFTHCEMTALTLKNFTKIPHLQLREVHFILDPHQRMHLRPMMFYGFVLGFTSVTTIFTYHFASFRRLQWSGGKKGLAFSFSLKRGSNFCKIINWCTKVYMHYIITITPKRRHPTTTRI